MIHKMNIRNFVALLALLFAASVVVGCNKDNGEPLAQRTTTITLPISIDTRASASQTVTDGEMAINEVRVYAFTGGKLAGHYYYSGDAVSKISLVRLKALCCTLSLTRHRSYVIPTQLHSVLLLRRQYLRVCTSPT